MTNLDLIKTLQKYEDGVEITFRNFKGVNYTVASEDSIALVNGKLSILIDIEEDII